MLSVSWDFVKPILHLEGDLEGDFRNFRNTEINEFHEPLAH